MSVCPKCNSEFVQTNPNYQRKFCSRSCANARTFTPEQESRRRAGIRAAANSRIFDYEKNRESIKLRAERYSVEKHENYLNVILMQLTIMRLVESAF